MSGKTWWFACPCRGYGARKGKCNNDEMSRESLLCRTCEKLRDVEIKSNVDQWIKVIQKP